MSLKMLGEKVAISAPTLSQIERGNREASGLLASALAETLEVEVSFFRDPRRVEHDDSGRGYHLRHRSTTPKKLKSKVFATGSLLGMLVETLKRKIDFPEDSVPAIQACSYEEIEKAAKASREHWGLGSGPISNTIRVLENGGVVVSKLAEDTKKIDAFSRAGRTSVVVLNSFKGSASRSRFDAAHELGHLVIHTGQNTGDKETEGQANRFASAFLLPRQPFSEDYRIAMRKPSWAAIFELKRSWKVSAPAIIRRAFDLDLIGPSEYRRSYKYMSAKGWLHGKIPEPNEPAAEIPELLTGAIARLEAYLGESPLDIANELGWSPSLFQKISGIDVSAYQETAGVASLDAWRRRKNLAQ